jgi:hypothetical protein
VNGEAASWRASVRLCALGLLVLFALFATILLQRWIGGMTVYAPELDAKRSELHQAIVENQPPPGRTWESLGARNTNTRVAVVWLAEGLHQSFGVPVLKAYFLIDTASLWLSLVLLFVLLRQWFEPIYCVVGVLYFIAVLPLTYLFYFFHPWDRVSQALWILMFLFIKRGQLPGLALALAASMIVKYDSVPVPAVYWLANATRATFVSVTIRAVGLSLMAALILVVLLVAFPGGAAPLSARDTLARIASNVEAMSRMTLIYPPLLMHGLPALVALVGWSRADRVARAGALVGVGCFVPLWFLGSNFHEVRAEVPLTILLLPAALYGLRWMLLQVQQPATLGASSATRGT